MIVDEKKNLEAVIDIKGRYEIRVDKDKTVTCLLL